MTGEHAPHNAMQEPGEIERFHDRCSDLMRKLIEFEGRRPYRFLDARSSRSRRWEMWMDSRQARAVRRAQRVDQNGEL